MTRTSFYKRMPYIEGDPGDPGEFTLETTATLEEWMKMVQVVPVGVSNTALDRIANALEEIVRLLKVKL